MKYLVLLLLLWPFTAQTARVDDIRACLQQNKYWDPYRARCETRMAQAVKADTLPAGCAWQQENFILDAINNITVSYRIRNCGAAQTHYVFDQATGALFRNTIKPENRVAQFWDYAPGDLQRFVEHLSARSLKPDEGPDCHLQYDPERHGFLYAPDSLYFVEILRAGPPGTICGDYGIKGESIGFFRILRDRILVFFRPGPNEALDPQSVTLQEN